jgi:hypothetical protein
VVLCVLTVVLVPVALVGWLAVAIRGRLPATIHAFAAGVLAWWARLAAYVLSLTDAFPPYSLRTAPGPARRVTSVISAGVGLLPVASVAAFTAFIVGFSGTHLVVGVPYQELRTGQLPPGRGTGQVESGPMALIAVADPADADLALFDPAPGSRFVAFDISIRNWRGAGETVPVTTAAFTLKSGDGSERRPLMVAVDGTPGAGAVGSGRAGTATVVFELPRDARPHRLTWDVVDYISTPRRGETIDWVLT